MATYKRRRPRVHDLRLKIAIIESNRTQRRIALDLRMSEVRLSKIISRREIPTPEEQERLARYLNRAVADLFDLPAEPDELDALENDSAAS
jgi:hypothetical protein